MRGPRRRPAPDLPETNGRHVDSSSQRSNLSKTFLPTDPIDGRGPFPVGCHRSSVTPPPMWTMNLGPVKGRWFPGPVVFDSYGPNLYPERHHFSP